jgi:hypothetical protein
MKQFIVTIPNPMTGNGARGLNRVAPAGEPSVSTFAVYAPDESLGLRLMRQALDVRSLPDGTRCALVADEPRVTTLQVVNLSKYLLFEGEYEAIDPVRVPRKTFSGTFVMPIQKLFNV